MLTVHYITLFFTKCQYYLIKTYVFAVRYNKITMKKGSTDEGVLYHAGFPNAGEDQRADSLSLDALVIRHRASTYFWRLETDIVEMNWPAGSIVVVDRSASLRKGKVAVGYGENEFIIGRSTDRGFICLRNQQIVAVEIWGVVTYVLSEVS